jgi:2-amino-4-hydroxy-6-hydroxymethyldihydropteridine diphosphokinase
LEQLQDNGDVTVLRRSGYYETSPVENTDQPFFINGVVEVDTRLSSRQLLDKIKVVEALFNMQPRINKGPRVIDLDILMFGDEHVDSDQLQVPHPAICRRKFVLVPLLEIEPDALCPVDHRRYDECLSLLNAPSQKVEVYHG